MLFNSIEFAVFLPIVFILHWFTTNKNIKSQNAVLLVASYVFYGWWDWRFLSLIIFSSCIDYFVGIGLGKSNDKRKRKLLVLTSIFINLSLLGFFKYFNFFAESFANAFTLLGKPIEVSRLNIILPVGISFYTFQTLSYTIDIYKQRLEPTLNALSFFAYVSFFPQLVAGPIERASNLLPQFYKKRVFEYDKAVDGMRQVLWGLFKKVVIADNCAQFANQIFENYTNLSGSTLVIGAIFFTFQIYGDFSGYSDIAIGIARFFGFNLMQNFAFPYFSRDIAEFWRRWHISLSTWFRDYVYIPLGGSKGGTWMKIKNTFIIFLVSGFWHGANWTFLVWGFLNACYFLPLILSNRNRNNLNSVAENKVFPSIKELFQIVITFCLVVFGWIFFRAESLDMAFSYIVRMMSISTFMPFQILTPKLQMLYSLWLIIPFIAIEWLQRNQQHALAIASKSKAFRWTAYISVFMLIITFGFFGKNEFIYFQF